MLIVYILIFCRSDCAAFGLRGAIAYWGIIYSCKSQVGIFIRICFYSSIQYSLMYRLIISERSNIPSIEDDSNQYKSNKYSASGQDESNSTHSTKSLIGGGKDIPIIEMAELEPKKISQDSLYSIHRPRLRRKLNSHHLLYGVFTLLLPIYREICTCIFHPCIIWNSY